MPVAVESETREALLDAAEELFAAEGLDGASLAAITRLAGQRNSGAIHYYFGGRDGLLMAIVDRHQAQLDAERMERLIELRSQPSSIEALVRVVIEPLSGRLDSASGRAFLAIQRHRVIELGESYEFRAASTRLIAAEMDAILGEDRVAAPDHAERTNLVTLMVVHRLADRAREEAQGTTTPRQVVIDTLVSAATSIITGDASSEG